MKSENIPIYFCAACGQRVRAEEVASNTTHLTGMAHVKKVDGKKVECGPVAMMVRTQDPMKQLAIFTRRELQSFDSRMAAELAEVKTTLQSAIEFHASLVLMPSEKEDLKPVLKSAVGHLLKLMDCLTDAESMVLVKTKEGEERLEGRALQASFYAYLDIIDEWLTGMIKEHPWAFDQPWVSRKKESPDDQSESERS